MSNSLPFDPFASEKTQQTEKPKKSLSYFFGLGLCRLFNNIYPNTKRKQKMFLLLVNRIMEWEDMSHFTIYRNSFGYRYSHFNTMEIDLPKSDGLYFFTEPEARQDWYFPRTKVSTYQVLWDEFVTDLERYIRDTSRHLESAGYQTAVGHYTDDEKQKLVELSVIVVEALENKTYDFLGSVFMGLELGDRYKAQHFTPSHVAHAMAAMTLSNCHELIQRRGFITLQEPTCGSGVMIIESYNYLRQEQFNPQQQMWVQARDLDFTAAMMCYIQMTLLHIPGEVIIGDTLKNEVHHHLYTTAHLWGNWDNKLACADLETEPEIQQIESEPVEELPFEIDWENEPMFY